MIREAVVTDVIPLVHQGAIFWQLSPFADKIGYNPNAVQNLLLQMIEDHFLIVATEGDEIVGFLGMLLGPVLFNPEYTQAVEVFFYVQPAYRGKGIAQQLHKEADLYLDDKVDVISFGDMSSSTDMDQFYTDRGFTLTERSYTKVL